jgi:hypothetical protein
MYIKQESFPTSSTCVSPPRSYSHPLRLKKQDAVSDNYTTTIQNNEDTTKFALVERQQEQRQPSQQQQEERQPSQQQVETVTVVTKKNVSNFVLVEQQQKEPQWRNKGGGCSKNESKSVFRVPTAAQSTTIFTTNQVNSVVVSREVTRQQSIFLLPPAIAPPKIIASMPLKTKLKRATWTTS